VKALQGQAAARAEPLETTLEDLVRHGLRAAGETPA